MKYLCLVLVVSLFIGIVYSQQQEEQERNRPQRPRCRSGSTAPAQRCNEYWRCINGYWRIVYCPYRQVYDQYRQRCNYPWNVRGRCGRLQGENEHEVAAGVAAGGAANVHALPLAEQEKKSKEAHSP